MPKSRHKNYKLQRIIDDIKSVRLKEVNDIFLTDDNPAENIEYFTELLNAITKEKLNKISYFCTVSVKSMTDYSITKLMKKAGFNRVFLGVENLYQKNLKNLNKKSNEKIINFDNRPYGDYVSGILYLLSTTARRHRLCPYGDLQRQRKHRWYSAGR